MTMPHERRVLPGHTDETTIGREWEENPFVRVWRGVEPEGDEPVRVGGEDATLVVWSPDYDGKGKAWVRFADGRDAIVGGSRVERAPSARPSTPGNTPIGARVSAVSITVAISTLGAARAAFRLAAGCRSGAMGAPIRGAPACGSRSASWSSPSRSCWPASSRAGTTSRSRARASSRPATRARSRASTARWFEFDAKRLADGSVRGSYRYRGFRNNLAFEASGPVTCLAGARAARVDRRPDRADERPARARRRHVVPGGRPRPRRRPGEPDRHERAPRRREALLQERAAAEVRGARRARAHRRPRLQPRLLARAPPGAASSNGVGSNATSSRIRFSRATVGACAGPSISGRATPARRTASRGGATRTRAAGSAPAPRRSAGCQPRCGRSRSIIFPVGQHLRYAEVEALAEGLGQGPATPARQRTTSVERDRLGGRRDPARRDHHRRPLDQRDDGLEDRRCRGRPRPPPATS